MPLQQLVEYFNDRLEQEHHNSLRAFVLEAGKVYGLFGPIRLTTQLTPIRETLRSVTTIGHSAQLKIAANPCHFLESLEYEQLINAAPATTAGFDSVINFDRLSRTVHMLNYLPQSHLDKLLFLDVDPRHILGIKEDHGAYFEEIINKCGLETQHVTIGLTINSVYARLYPTLLKGLENYQRRAYRILLKFDVNVLPKATEELILRLAPDFVGVSAINLDQIRDSQQLTKLHDLHSLTASVHGRSILFDVEDKRHANLARQIGFNLVQGDYLEHPESELAEYGLETRKHSPAKGLVIRL